MPLALQGLPQVIGPDRLEFLFSVRFEIGVENSIAPGAKYTLLTRGRKPLSRLLVSYLSQPSSMAFRPLAAKVWVCTPSWKIA